MTDHIERVYSLKSKFSYTADTIHISQVRKDVLHLRDGNPELHRQVLQEYFDYIHQLLEKRLDDFALRGSIDSNEKRQIKKLVDILIEVKGIQLGEGE